MDPILKAAKAEEKKLLAELAADPRYQRLEAVRKVILLYGDPAQSAPKITMPSGDDLTVPKIVDGGHSMRGLAQRIVEQAFAGTPRTRTAIVCEAAETFLRNKGERARSEEIAQALLSQGIALGKRPASTVSAFLAGAPSRFDNVKPHGYGLTEWSRNGLHKDEAPDDETPGASSSTVGVA